MSFRLRRGTDSERQSVVFAEGELVYTTDTKELYVGDGTTLGGIRITGEASVSPIALTQNLDLNSFDVVGSGDIDISGQITANSFYGNGSGLTNLPVLDVNNGATYQISIMGADSSILVNSDTSELFGTFNGNINGSLFDSNNNIMIDNVLRTMSGKLDGEFNGVSSGEFNGTSSGLFIGDDSSVMVDGTTSTFYGKFSGDASNLTNFPPDIGITEGSSYNINIVGGDIVADNSSLIIDGKTGDIYSDRLYTDTIVNTNNSLNVVDSTAGNNAITIQATDGIASTNFVRKSDDNLSGNTSIPYGGLLWGRNDTNGPFTTVVNYGYEHLWMVAVANDGSFTQDKHIVWTDGKFGIGNWAPDEALVVAGNAKVDGFVQFGSLSSTDRDALTPAFGMVIYNTTTNTFQGYQNTGGTTTEWVNLS